MGDSAMQVDSVPPERESALYTPLTLRFYDTVVHRFSNRFVWRCTARELLDLYERNVSACHLDVGVGTGFLLDHARFPTERPSVTLMDVNTACLEMASRRIARHAPRVVQSSILEPLPPIGPFSSVGLCYLLHCLPGDIPSKAVAFDHLQAVMAPAARIFGATLVQGSAPRSWMARRLMAFYNRKGFFSNTQDTAEDLETEMRSRFSDVRIRMRGSVAVFEARKA
jgi:hypothetical protein